MWTRCAFVLACFCAVCFGNPHKCDEVRKVFQLRQIGPTQMLPLSPRPGSDLQVCRSKSQTCCTKKMEERYQIAARRDIENLLQTSSSSLKFLISRNLAAFQGTFELLRRQAENQTNAMLQQSYGNMADQVRGPVGELFTDISLFLLGSELNVEDFVQRFFDSLFPIVYNNIINPGLINLAAGYAECVRSVSRDVRPFGGTPALLADQIARSGLSGKLLLQALHLGIEVINTTDHLQLSRECRKALLKMHYCPHCQGLTQSKPCMGYCLNVMRGCLASMAEIDIHWREFVHSLEDLSARMHGTQDLEQVLLGIHTLLQDAIGLVQRNGQRITTQVHKFCGPPSRKAVHTTSIQQRLSRESIHPKTSAKPLSDTLAVKRRDFLNSLRLYRTYYGGLADQLCVSELASDDGGLSCWNGTDIVKSYTLRVVGNGIKAQADNPEVKVKGADSVIHQIIDKLKHINQLLQGKSIPKLGTLDQIETGSGDAEGHYSGDCDDEDGCDGSAGGEVKKNIQKVSKLNPNVSSDHHHHHPPIKEAKVKVSSRSIRLTANFVAMTMTCLHVLLAL
ncbi:glypican-5a [Syngnathus acus]|uniref:glypican-5a n=1 Tax=Syngnathus acus TaxID=161584 RepID=UPI001885DEEA|nr:glypican-5a [Syngnathus acus]